MDGIVSIEQGFLAHSSPFLGLKEQHFLPNYTSLSAGRPMNCWSIGTIYQ
jgi:hypothetical protein